MMMLLLLLLLVPLEFPPLPLPLSPLSLLLLLMVMGLVILVILRATKRRRGRGRGRGRRRGVMRVPPGPPAWPLVGNLVQLVGWSKPNECLWMLALKYGPLMSLRLGCKRAVVVSSAAMAEHILKHKDHIFAGRSVIQAAQCMSYHENSMIWCQYGPRWRLLRKMFNTQLLGHSKLHLSKPLRRHHTDRMINLLATTANHSHHAHAHGVDVGQIVFLMSINLLANMMFGEDMFQQQQQQQQAQQFKDLIWSIMELGGMSNLADFFPLLAWLDPQGIRRRIVPCIAKIYSLFDHVIQDRITARSSSSSSVSNSNKDFLDILLAFCTKPDQQCLFDVNAIKSLFLDIFQAGPHVTATTIEWAMAELLAKPAVLERAQQEICAHVGLNRKVEEDDIDKLLYVNAIIKEVLRLHPPAPLLSNRADQDCNIAGFLIPKNTQTIINVWALGRDPASWNRPSEFIPERFLSGNDNFCSSSIDYRGHHFELIPFGAGRRICPGLPFAHRMLHLILASLIHSFNWSVVNGGTGSTSTIDMTDKFGLSLQKAVPLKAIPTPRLPPSLYQ